jgi:hypothetical protein
MIRLISKIGSIRTWCVLFSYSIIVNDKYQLTKNEMDLIMFAHDGIIEATFDEFKTIPTKVHVC